MKVYAQYFEIDNIVYRVNTILQFGDSWKLIGNAVLANPGSATPTKEINDTVQKELQAFYKNFIDRNLDLKNWFEFSDDQTMQRIEKIFNGWYINQEKPTNLNGIIQLFNTFNVKNQNLAQSIEKLPIDNKFLFSDGIEKYFNDKPTYFGFSNDIIYNKRLRPIAESIFCRSSEIIKQLYNDDFSKNSFYHPTFINRSYKREFFQKYMTNVLIPFHQLVINS